MSTKTKNERLDIYKIKTKNQINLTDPEDHVQLSPRLPSEGIEQGLESPLVSHKAELHSIIETKQK